MDTQTLQPGDFPIEIVVGSGVAPIILYGIYRIWYNVFRTDNSEDPNRNPVVHVHTKIRSNLSAHELHNIDIRGKIVIFLRHPHLDLIEAFLIPQDIPLMEYYIEVLHVDIIRLERIIEPIRRRFVGYYIIRPLVRNLRNNYIFFQIEYIKKICFLRKLEAVIQEYDSSYLGQDIYKYEVEWLELDYETL